MKKRVALGVITASVALFLTFGRPTLLDETPFGVAIVDRDGKLMRLATAADERYRVYTQLHELAPEVIEATLLYEDRYFRWHPGVNPLAVGHALVDAIAGAPRRGASTITMQLARLRFGLKTTTILGKLVQMARAVQLEVFYSKDAILEAYLNIAPYGGNIEGVGAASLVYFGKSATSLSRAESLTLAVMPQSPNRRAPTRDGLTPTDMRAARQRLIDAWRERVPDDAEAVLAAASDDLAARPRSELPFEAPHFTSSLLGQRGAPLGPTPSTIRTTIDHTMQELLERRIAGWVERGRERGIVNAAGMLVDIRTMEVLASVGSAAFTDNTIDGQVDGTRAHRSPGSTLKPFVYALAIEHGLIHPRSILEDAPARYGIYEPENFDSGFAGPINATDALTRSRNLPAVELESRLQHIAGGSLYDLLNRMRLHGLAARETYGLSHVLGSANISMRDLVVLYAALANGGRAMPLRDTEMVPTADYPVTSPEAAALVLDMLSSQERPHGSSFMNVRDQVEVAWKTGTSYGFRDAWTVAIFGQYVMAVWIGNFDGRGNPAFVGRSAAAPLAFEIIDALRPYVVAPHKPLLPAITTTDVCAISGMIPGPHCSRRARTSFIAQVSPIAACDVHVQVVVDDKTGERVCPGETIGPGRHADIYELWPSNIARIFERAGLDRRKPPPYAARCHLDDRGVIGKPPRITSPQSVITYNIRIDDPGSALVPFSAITGADARSVRWFVDERYVGSAAANETFLWPSHPGNFIVRAVDDNGRADSQHLLVERVQ